MAEQTKRAPSEPTPGEKRRRIAELKAQLPAHIVQQVSRARRQSKGSLAYEWNELPVSVQEHLLDEERGALAEFLFLNELAAPDADAGRVADQQANLADALYAGRDRIAELERRIERALAELEFAKRPAARGVQVGTAAQRLRDGINHAIARLRGES